MLMRSLRSVASGRVNFNSVARLSVASKAQVSFDIGPDNYKQYLLEDAPSSVVEAEKDELLHYFKQMVTVRRMETAAGEAYRSKLIRGFLHLYTGQEAVCTGMKAAMGEKDSLITAYRCHGWAYMLNYSVKQVLAELFGRVDGCQMGKGGSMHMYGERFYGGNGIVGAQVPVGAGVALAQKQLGENGVCYSLYGDGASNQGQVFEAYNIAKLWKLPVVFVCENNKFGMGTSNVRSSATVEYYKRGQYMPGLWVNGMDVLAVKEATRFAREYALEQGPIVMEVETYRYHGHSMSDPDNTYRTREDIKEVRENKDCILNLQRKIIDAGFATDKELKNIEKEVRAAVNKELKAAQQSPQPPMETLYDHILYEEKVTDVRGCDLDTWYSQK